MIDLTLDMRQYDCPFIDTSDDHPVSFSTVHWEFHETADQLETRMLVEGDGRDALDRGLRGLRDHAGMCEFDLLAKQGPVAHIRTAIEETAAMSTIRGNDGFITGPFHIESGSEQWQVGFDRERAAEDTLSDLDRNNDYEVVERESVDLAEVAGFVRNVGAAMTLIEGCKDLSDTERETLEAAVDEGYFESPRDADLGTLAERFGVSKPAVSKTLRRGQRKAMQRVVEAMDDLE